MTSVLGALGLGVGSGSIGSATVDLFLNTTGYSAQLEKAKLETGAMTKSSSGLTSALGGMSKGMTVGAGAAAILVTGISRAIHSTTEWAAEVRSLQRVTGQSAEQASALAAAGNTLGIETSKLATGFGLLSKNIVNNSENLTKYGIATKDATGAVLPFDEVLGNVADKFATLPKGPEQAALAMNAFGRSGKDLIPVLQRGSAGLQELADKAAAAGLIMSEADLTASKNLSIAQRELGEAFKGAAVQVGKQFVPAMTSLTTALTGFATKVAPIVADVLTPFADALTATADGVTGILNLIPGTTVTIDDYATHTTKAQEATAGWHDKWTELMGQVNAGNLTMDEAKAKLDEWVAKALEAGTATKDLGHEIQLFAGMTKSELSDWEDGVTTSLTDTFSTLGTKTKDIFNVTSQELSNQFASMLRQTIRYKRDQEALLSLKPGSFGISKEDLQQFEQFMIDQGPGYVDAFVRSSKSAQQEDINNWEAHQQKINATINGLPDEHVVHLKWDLGNISGAVQSGINQIDRALQDALNRIGN